MKQIKRIIAAVVVAVMTMGLFVTTAWAEPEEGPYDITITKKTEDKVAHTYGAYQIFKGDLDVTTVGEGEAAVTTKTLSNIQWGDNVNGATAITELKKITEFAALPDDATAADVAKAISDANVADDSYVAKKIADAFNKALTGDPKETTTIDAGGTTGTIRVQKAGYYLVKDTEDVTGQGSETRYILEVVSDVEVTEKASVPSAVKKVQDINDSDATPTLSLQDSADYDIGDTIPYTVKATIGTGINNFANYSVQFVDTMSKGLTLDVSNWDIKVGNTSIKNSFTLTSAAGADGATVWTWAATDIRSSISDGSEVVLTYNCTLNSDAVLGSAGNPNTVQLKFDNNPNDCGKGTPAGETPADKNVVFTYKTVFNKVDEDNHALTGADFKLEKKVNGSWVDVTTLGSGNIHPTKTGDTSSSTFTFSGLDDGDYKLTETTTPSGYNTMEPIEFTITAAHDVESDDPKLTSLTGTDGHEFTMIPDLTAGSLTVDILNEKGSVLPSTGGIGTTVFYIIGSALVLGAGVLLATKKKAAN